MLTNEKRNTLKQTQAAARKIYPDIKTLKEEVNRQRFKGRTIVFTNGCFDILHAGHIESFNKAAGLGDVLIVAVNTDDSVKRLQKAPNRPINNENARLTLLSSLVMIDAVILFNEDTPYSLITALMPDVLVKGGDYTVDQVVGAKEVIANGGRVEIISLLPGFSTTGIIEKAQKGGD